MRRRRPGRRAGPAVPGSARRPSGLAGRFGCSSTRPVGVLRTDRFAGRRPCRSRACMSSSKLLAKAATPSSSRHLGHVVHVDADLGQAGRGGPRPRRRRGRRCGPRCRGPEGLHGGVGHGVDGVGADQVVDVEQVGVGRVLGRRRRPQRPLAVGALRLRSASQRAPEKRSWNSW